MGQSCSGTECGWSGGCTLGRCERCVRPVRLLLLFTSVRLETTANVSKHWSNSRTTSSSAHIPGISLHFTVRSLSPPTAEGYCETGSNTLTANIRSHTHRYTSYISITRPSRIQEPQRLSDPQIHDHMRRGQAAVTSLFPENEKSPVQTGHSVRREKAKVSLDR